MRVPLHETIASSEDTCTTIDFCGMQEKIGQVLRTLTFRESEIVQLRFGLFGRGMHTLAELGQMFQVTPERIRGIEAQALHKLRNPFRSHPLEQYVPQWPLGTVKH